MMSSWVSLCLVLCLVSSAAGQPNSVPKTTYLVKVTTGNMGLDPEPAAGDQVFIKLSGEKNVTDFKELRKDGNAFKNGSEAEFTITAKDVGNITAITIKKTATSLPKEDWRLRQVVIEDSKGTIYEFSCMCWISKAMGLEKTLKPCKVIPPTVSSTQAKPTSPSSSSSASPSASGSPTSGSTATPTNGEGTSEPAVASGATSAKLTASPGEATRPTSSKPSGSASSPSPSSGPTSKTSASLSPTSEASSGSSTQPSSTSGSSTQPTSSPKSNPSSSGASPSGSVASKPTEPSSKPTASTGQTSAKVTSSTGAKSSNPTSKPTAPTREQPSSASSVKPPGKPSKQPSSVAPTSESGSTTAPTSMPTSGPTSEASTAAIDTKPSGPSSKPTAPTSKKPSTPSKAKTSGPGSSGKPPGAASTKPSATISIKPSGPASIATPSGPSSSAKPSGPSSIATPSGPSSSTKPSGPSSIATPSAPSSSAKPSGPSSIATPSAPSSSAKPSGPSSIATPSAPKGAKPSGPAISTTAKPSGSPSTKPSGSSSSTTSGSSPSGASPTRSTAVTSPGNSSSVPTTRPTPSQPHAAFINGLLHEMNVMRLLHGVGPFLLEKNMSQVAQKKAGKSIKRGSIEDETENTYGMATCKLEGTPQEMDAAKKCVSKWYATVKDFDWSNPRVTPKTSQFSQLVWKATTHVGIGVAGKNVVVYFDPPSNEMESAKDNVPPVTELSDGTFHACPEGFRLSSSSCFKFNAAPSTWAKAIETCAHHGATIASLQSQEENTFINGMISGLQNSDTSETWIGFNDRITESSYQWVDGSVVKFHQFLQTEPTGIGENCVALKNTKNETGWEDKKCTDILPSLCRRPAEGPITYKITFLIEIVIQNPSSKKTVIPPPGGKDRATLIKEKLNSTSSKKPIEFVGESTETGPDGGNYYSVIVKVPPGTNPDFVQPLQNYLDNHNNHIYPGSKEKVFIASVTVNNPANGMCYSTCFTTCSNQCSPMCCSGTYIINPSTQSQAPPYQPGYNYANGYQYPAASSYSSSYLPGYPYSSPSAQQNSLSVTNPYMSRNIMACARACTRISRNDFCPPYCPKRCCRARSFQPRFFARPRFYSLKK